MPRIALNDALGLNVDGKLAPGAKISSILPKIAQWKDLKLDEVPLDQGQVGFDFSQPLAVQAGPFALEAGGGASSSVALLGRRKRSIDELDPFDAIPIADGEIYVALGLDLSASAGASGTAAMASFGLSVEKDLTLRCYRRFLSGPQGYPRFSKAFRDTAESFLLPLTLADLGEIPSDVVLVAAGNGSLTISGGMSVQLPVDSIKASAVLAGKPVAIQAGGGSVGVDASVTISGGYQIRLRRLAARKVEIGVYTVRSAAESLSVTAKIGASAPLGQFDLAEQFFKALNPQAVLDVDEFRRALPGENQDARERQIETLQAALTDAVSTKVQLSVRAALSALQLEDAAWTYEIDLDAAASPAATKAIGHALLGNFQDLTRDPNALPAGIRETSNILSRLDLKTLKLRVNLLGLLNYLDVSKISRASAIEKDAAGNITMITDTSSASQIQAVMLNLAGSVPRLQQMLSENFLLEAGYHVSQSAVLAPEFRSRHTYLEVHDSTARADMKDNLDVARVLGLISQQQEDLRLGAQKQFGRTTFYAELKYSAEQVRGIFLTAAGESRPVEEFETLGRRALAELLTGDDGQEFRKRLANPGPAGSQLWAELKKIGNVNGFGPLFGVSPGSTDPRVAAAGSDYLAIRWWADAMHGAGVVIHELDDMVKGGSKAPDDPKFARAREHLKRKMADVVKLSEAHFGDPLGVLMVYLAAGERGEKRVIVDGGNIQALAATAKS